MVRIRPKPERFSEPTNLQKHRKSRRLLDFLFLITSLKSSLFRANYFANILSQRSSRLEIDVNQASQNLSLNDEMQRLLAILPN